METEASGETTEEAAAEGEAETETEGIMHGAFGLMITGGPGLA